MVLSMMLAHWCYFGAGIISLVFLREKEELITTMRVSILKLHQIAYNPGEVGAINLEETTEGKHMVTDTGEINSENTKEGNSLITKYWVPITESFFAATIAISVSVSIAVSNSAGDNGIHMCPSYCELYKKAVEVCPCYVLYYVTEAARLESREGCIVECEEAHSSKSDSDLS